MFIAHKIDGKARTPLGALCVLLVLCACSFSPKEQLLRGSTMGTTWSVKIGGSEFPVEHGALQRIIQSELDGINAEFSNWDPSSSISRFNLLEAGCVRSPRLAALMKESKKIEALTDGAFDVTVSPLIELWGFGTQWSTDDIPASDRIKASMSHMGGEKIQVNDDEICKLSAGVSINLSAIAKGYAVDVVAEKLIELGYRHYLVEVGGELTAAGLNTRSQPWQVGIKRPQSDMQQALTDVAIGLSGKSIATSGDYYNYFELDGKRYSHILNPATGYPVEHSVSSVTVIAPLCSTADAWATALLVLGPEAGLRIAEEQGLPVLMLEHQGSTIRALTSSHWVD